MHDQQIPDLPPEVQRRWDEWCDARIVAIVDDALGEAADFLGEEMAKSDNVIHKLQTEVSQLRADIETLSKVNKVSRAEKNTDNVTELPSFLRKGA
jgi:hypothetical protein